MTNQNNSKWVSVYRQRLKQLFRDNPKTQTAEERNIFLRNTREHFKVVPNEQTRKWFAPQVCSAQSLSGSQGKEMRQIVCDN